MIALNVPGVTSIASWFGSNRTLAHHVGQELEGCSCVAIPFAGGMSEFPYINARTVLVNDVHRHLINMARVAGDPELGPMLYRRLRRTAYHPDVLAAAQERCRQRDVEACKMDSSNLELSQSANALDWAYDYFLCAWMIRHATAGKKSEFTGGLSMRWDGNGGDSNTHFRSAATSLCSWRRLFLGRCNFSVLDFRTFLDKCRDIKGVGIYSDAPFPDAGEGYKHTFSEEDHVELAKRLGSFVTARVVCRFHRHPLIEKLYQPPRWQWRDLQGRDQNNNRTPEVLILNGPSIAEQPTSFG